MDVEAALGREQKDFHPIKYVLYSHGGGGVMGLKSTLKHKAKFNVSPSA